MTGTPGLSLADGLDLAGIDYHTLWTQYLALGGRGTVAELRARIQGTAPLDDYDHNVIAQAINETFLDRDQNHPVTYRGSHGS